MKGAVRGHVKLYGGPAAWRTSDDEQYLYQITVRIADTVLSAWLAEVERLARDRGGRLLLTAHLLPTDDGGALDRALGDALRLEPVANHSHRDILYRWVEVMARGSGDDLALPGGGEIYRRNTSQWEVRFV